MPIEIHDVAARSGASLIGCAPRAVAAALLGALAGATWLVLAYAMHPGVSVQLDRDLRAIATGFYGAERNDTGVFVWTAGHAAIRLRGLDRRTPWTCVVSVRGARPDPATLPEVTFAVDGVQATKIATTNTYQRVHVEVPPLLIGRDLVLTLTPSSTFTPGTHDARQLGVMVNELSCRPAGNGIPLAPRNAVAGAGIASALFGAAIGLTGVTPGSAVVGAIVLAGAQTIPLSDDLAPYVGYAATAPWLALWIALAMVAAVRLTEWATGQPLRNTARFAVVFSAGALYLKLLALLHPSKAVVDALFQAHRLEWVLSGRFFFTQPLPDGVQFPYAIGLYLFAAPWSFLTSDHVLLLRIVVCAAEAVAGALLYLLVVRTWGDRLVAAFAVALFGVVPISYGVIGNGNLTNSFGQSVALVALVMAAIATLGPAHPLQLALLVLVTTLAFLSHVSTFSILVVTMLALSAFCRALGGAALALPARRVFGVTVLAMLLAIVSYYGHFGDSYARLGRVRGASAAAVTIAVPSLTPGGQSGVPAAQARAPRTLAGRVSDALVATIDAIGWPILVLAVLGAWRLAVEGPRDTLTFLIAAWAAACAVFLGVGILGRVDVQYQRYAAEFVSRAELATYPAAVILAARGAVWAWRARTGTRVVSVVLLLAAIVVGMQQWTRWLE